MAINTHVRLFQVSSLQQDVKTAPGIFQKVVDTMLSGIDTFGFIDDMITAGEDENDHKVQLFSTLQQLQDYGFKLQPDKCQFGVTEDDFCGHKINKNASGHILANCSHFKSCLSWSHQLLWQIHQRHDQTEGTIRRTPEERCQIRVRPSWRQGF